MSRKKLSRLELKEALYRRRYLIPNIVTLANLFAGFLTIIYAASGRFDKAVIAIAVAIVLDGIDGRVARRLNATSKFGLEFDSFADLVSFGVAPALLMYYWGFSLVADEFGVFVTFIFVLCAASRLVRFNIADENMRVFVGLPTPGAAAMVAAIVNFEPFVTQQPGLIVLNSLIIVSLSFLMVSQVEFFSIKGLKIKGMHYGWRVLIGMLIALIWYNHQIGFLALAGAYCASGPLSLLKKKKAALSESGEEEEKSEKPE